MIQLSVLILKGSLMSKFTKTILFALVACRALESFATITWNGETFPTTTAEASSLGYVTLTTGDNVATRDSSYTNSVRWSDGKLPHADAKYFDGAGFLIDPNAGNLVTIDGVTRRANDFAGKRVVLGDNMVFATCCGGTTAATATSFGEEGFFSVGGNALRNWAGNIHLKGPFTILNGNGTYNSARNFYIEYSSTRNGAMHFHGPWRTRDNGTSEVRVFFTRGYSTTAQMGAFAAHLDGDLSGVIGRFVAETNCSIAVNSSMPTGAIQLGLQGVTNRDTQGLAPVESGLNGEFQTEAAQGSALTFKEIYSNGGTVTLNASNTWTVATLKLKAGILKAALNPATETMPALTVTDALVFEQKPVKLVLSGSDASVLGKSCRVLSAPTGSFAESDFTIVNPDNLVLSFRDDGTMATLTATRYNDVRTIRAMGATDSTSYSTPFDSATDASGNFFWSDHLAPHADADYIVEHNIPLPSNTEAMPKFAGHSLTLTKGVYLPSGNANPFTVGFEVADLRLKGLCQIRVWSGEKTRNERGLFPYTIAGNITIPEGETGRLQPFGERVIVTSSELHGTGTLWLDTNNDCSVPFGYHELTALNTDFKGQILASVVTKETRSVPSEANKVTVFVTDGRNLGGSLEAFRHDAIQFEQMSLLKVTNDVTLDQANRGFLVKGTARLEAAAGTTLKLATPLTLNGQLRKEGAGTLALAGKLRFGLNDNLSDTTAPSADANLIRVRAGSLKPMATAALDGAEVRFSPETSLVYDVNPTDAQMAEYGPSFKSSGTPFSFEGGATKVKVVLDKGVDYATEPPTNHRVALGTFATKAAAEGAAALMDVVRPYDHGRVVLEIVERADGTATLMCDYCQMGLILIYK